MRNKTAPASPCNPELGSDLLACAYPLPLKAYPVMSTPNQDHELPIEISVEDAAALLKEQQSVFLLDCRENDEYEIAHIAGSELIPLGTIPRMAEARLPNDKDRRILVYCHHGGRSRHATQWLRENGYLHSQSLSGGIDAWSQKIDHSVPRY